MAFDIRIKPLVLFDLEDKIKSEENKATGAGKEFYENFLKSLSELQELNNTSMPLYGSVQKFVTPTLSCNLFYIVNDNTILVMGIS